MFGSLVHIHSRTTISNVWRISEPRLHRMSRRKLYRSTFIVDFLFLYRLPGPTLDNQQRCSVFYVLRFIFRVPSSKDPKAIGKDSSHKKPKYEITNKETQIWNNQQRITKLNSNLSQHNFLKKCKKARICILNLSKFELYWWIKTIILALHFPLSLKCFITYAMVSFRNSVRRTYIMPLYRFTIVYVNL